MDGVKVTPDKIHELLGALAQESMVDDVEDVIGMKYMRKFEQSR